MTKSWKWKWTWVFGLLAGVPAVQAQNWNGMLNRLGDHVGSTVEQRLNGASDKAVNKAFDKTDDSVDCAVREKQRRSAGCWLGQREVPGDRRRLSQASEGAWPDGRDRQ